MRLLVSDANIFIDLEEGGLIEPLFALPWRCRVPDLLFFDELEERHGHLVDFGLELGELSPATMDEVERLTGIYGHPSRYDCFALALAKQERSPLLTGDAALRAAAIRESVVVAGTIWLVEAMVVHQLISLEKAQVAYQRMREGGSRLPWDDAHSRLPRVANGELEFRDLFKELEQAPVLDE